MKFAPPAATAPLVVAPRETRSSKSDLLFALAITAIVTLAFALRIYRLGSNDLWGDEAFSAYLAQQSFSKIFRDLAQAEPHPPFYPLLLWGWAKLAGHGEFALRFVSVFFGTVLVPLAAVVGRRVQDRQLGVIAALVVAVNPFLVWYSQETRMYIVVASSATWAATALLGGLSGQRRWWLSLSVATLVTIYSHYYGLLVTAAFLSIALAAVVSRRLPARGSLIALAIVVLGYLPWVLYASRIFFSYYGSAPGRVDLVAVFENFWLRALVGWPIERAEGIWWAVPLLALSIVGLPYLPAVRSTRWSVPSRRAVLLVAWLLVPLLAGLLISIVRPMYAERYLIVSAVPLLILLARGIAWLRWWRPVQAAALLLVLVSAAIPLQAQYTDPRYVKSEYSQHTRQVEALAQPGDTIILDGASQSALFDYYYRGSLPHSPVPSDLPLDEQATAARLRELTGRHSGVWAFLYATHDYDPTDFVERWLSENAYRAWHTWTVNGRLVYFASYPPEALVSRPGSALFGESLRLKAFATRLGAYAAGQVIPLRLRWTAIAKPTEDLKLSLRLRDAEGFLWGETDVEPVSGFRPTRAWEVGDEVDDRLGVLITPGTPPGRYSLELRAYPPGGPALPVKPENLSAGADYASLGEVVVAQPSLSATGAGIPAFRQIGAVFGEQIEVAGGSGAGEVTAGQSAYLTLLFRSLRAGAAELEAVLSVVDSQGRTVGQTVTNPANGGYGPARWQPGEVLRWQYNLRIPPQVAGGEYRLFLGLRPSQGATPLRLSGVSGAIALDNAVEIQRLVVRPRPQQVAATRPRVALRAVLGEKIELRGYSLDPPNPIPGGKLSLTLYWAPLADSDTSYTVFTHLLDGRDSIWAQQDAQPCSGRCPTTTWAQGDLIEDHYELTIKPDAVAGEYQIELGMYDPATGKRLAVVDDSGQAVGDRLLLPKLEIGP